MIFFLDHNQYIIIVSEINQKHGWNQFKLVNHWEITWCSSRKTYIFLLVSVLTASFGVWLKVKSVSLDLYISIQVLEYLGLLIFRWFRLYQMDKKKHPNDSLLVLFSVGVRSSGSEFVDSWECMRMPNLMGWAHSGYLIRRMEMRQVGALIRRRQEISPRVTARGSINHADLLRERRRNQHNFTFQNEVNSYTLDYLLMFFGLQNWWGMGGLIIPRAPWWSGESGGDYLFRIYAWKPARTKPTRPTPEATSWLKVPWEKGMGHMSAFPTSLLSIFEAWSTRSNEGVGHAYLDVAKPGTTYAQDVRQAAHLEPSLNHSGCRVA
jgi:hypothetical protein